MWTTALADSGSRWLQPDVAWRTWLHRAMTWLREALCGIRGHTLLLHYESDRLCLECAECGYQTAGWHVSPSSRGTRRRR